MNRGLSPITLSFAGAVIYPITLYKLREYSNQHAVEYLQKKCDTEAGEFIYRAVDNVEGVFQMRSRDPRDYFDRLKTRDIPEDPWGHTNWEAQTPETLFVNPPWRTYRFFERHLPIDIKPMTPQAKYQRYSGYAQKKKHPMVEEQVGELQSQYGYTWREVRDELDIKHGVRGGELIVKDLRTDETLAIKRGFFLARNLDSQYFQPSYSLCPRGDGSEMVYNFLSKVLRPPQPEKMESKP
jgi:hypothetical protein